MPMLELADVPALYAGRQVRWLLHWSEVIFPKINAMGTVPNLLLAVACFFKRNESKIAGVKWPVLAGAFLCNIGATAWTLIIMSPINNGMRRESQKVEDNPDDKTAEREFRRLQAKWRAYAYGECCVMAFVCVIPASFKHLFVCDNWLTFPQVVLPLCSRLVFWGCTRSGSTDGSFSTRRGNQYVRGMELALWR